MLIMMNRTINTDNQKFICNNKDSRLRRVYEDKNSIEDYVLSSGRRTAVESVNLRA